MFSVQIITRLIRPSSQTIPLEEPGLRCAGSSTGEAILADPYRHNHPLLKPLTLDRSAKLSRHAACHKSAAKSAGACRSGYRGPPLSVQTITTSLSGGAHETSNVPAAADRAPYLSEFVASSCTTIANVVADASPTPIRGTETHPSAESAHIVIRSKQHRNAEQRGLSFMARERTDEVMRASQRR